MNLALRTNESLCGTLRQAAPAQSAEDALQSGIAITDRIRNVPKKYVNFKLSVQNRLTHRETVCEID